MAKKGLMGESAFDLGLKRRVGFGLLEKREESFPEGKEEGHNMRSRAGQLHGYRGFVRGRCGWVR